MDRALFFVHIRESVFGGHMTTSQVSGLDCILDYKDKNFPATSILDFAYELATMTWETARTMQPIEEYGHGKSRSYGHPAGVWHVVYDGRGDVQLTWEANYIHADKRLHELNLLTKDENLAKTPTLAMRPDIAAAIIMVGMTEGWFTGKKLSTFIHDAVCDYRSCRRIINGVDHKDQIAVLAQSYRHALETASNAQKAA